MKILTEQLSNNVVSLSGLLIGVAIASIVFLVVYQSGKKKRLFDERHKYLNNQAKSMSWNVTFIGILVAWVLAIVFDGISLSFFLFTGIYLLHCLSFLFSTIYYTNQS